ncbi:MAG: TetR family transcriptional regulator [Myxococcota bacterium]|nr:TetR family transcriptional regulator [Myxococcota bacterium]
MARTTAGDWLLEGLAILREHGEASLTIEHLCRRLGRTKGAFYHHFPEIADYHDALLARWEQDLTERPIVVAEAASDPARRAARLGDAVRGLDHRLDLAVRAWALRDPRVRAVMERVDARRVAYLAELWAESTGRRAGALHLARLEYAAFVGAQQLYPDLSARVARGLDADLTRALRLLAAEEDDVAATSSSE